MRLCLLMARRYPPYGKWLGSAFSQLPSSPGPELLAALAATDWRIREQYLGDAYEKVAATHNALGITGYVDPTTRPYFSRPYRVIGAGRFVNALQETITSRTLAGGIDHYVDNTDVLGSIDTTRAITTTVHRTRTTTAQTDTPANVAIVRTSQADLNSG
jgi:hypothetical protein